MHAFLAVMALVLCMLPIGLGIMALLSTVETTTIVLFIFGIFGSAVFCVALSKVKIADQLYSWVVLNEQGICVKPLLKKNYFLEYSKCAEIEVAGYVHHSYTVGSIVKYIYFSYDRIAQDKKTRLNTIHSTKRFVKVAYSDKLYNYLMETLPQRQAFILEKSKKELSNY